MSKFFFVITHSLTPTHTHPQSHSHPLTLPLNLTGKSPILLPPRDYDTVHRQKGNLSNIDTRRCLNQNIVGVNARRKLESSGGSSGIGSDLAPSPERNEYRQHDNHSTSGELLLLLVLKSFFNTFCCSASRFSEDLRTLEIQM